MHSQVNNNPVSQYGNQALPGYTGEQIPRHNYPKPPNGNEFPGAGLSGGPPPMAGPQVGQDPGMRGPFPTSQHHPANTVGIPPPARSNYNYQQQPPPQAQSPTQLPPGNPQPNYQPPPHPPTSAQLANNMANMNINGVQRSGLVGKAMYPTHPSINGSGDVANGDIRYQNRHPQESYGGQGVNYQNSQPGGYPGRAGYPTQQPAYVVNPTANTYPSNQQAYSQAGQQPQQGYPPQQPAFPASQPSYPTSQGYGDYQQKNTLEPSLMPSPTQVIKIDQNNRSGMYYTNQTGQMPPLVTTDFIVEDQGNASPRFIRSTVYSVPTTADIAKQSSVPFVLVVSPMAETHPDEITPPIVDMGELGPVRCARCKAYMCPNMQFTDGGRKFHCRLCKSSTDVPPDYFQHLDHNGLRMDRFERPELILGTYEFVATKEYCRDNTFPKPPALIFVIDVSYCNVKSGLVSLLCTRMKQLLENLPKENGQEKSSLRVGFITYNKSVHFYNINPALGQPQMMVVSDVNDIFMPLLDGFLVDPVDACTIIDSLMQQIPVLFQDTKETETVLAPAIQAGLEALKASGIAGKLFVFHSSLPSYDAPGKLKNRDDRKLLGTDKEKSVLTPQNTVYNNLGQDCVQAGCSVDLFIFNNAYIDLATIGQVSRLTGGDIFKYTYFQADLDGERLILDLEKTISKLSAFDGIMRVRTSSGIRPQSFYGHFFMSNTTDIEFAAINCDKAVAVEVKHDDKLVEEEGVFVQAALLYTSVSGQRRIRVINLALKACSQMTDLYRSCELDTLINFLSKQAVTKLNDNTPKAVKDSAVARSAQILACYRKKCSTPASSNQLILPECIKLLPLYINCLLKSDAVSGGSDMTVDDRWWTMAAVMTMDIPSSVVYFYPRMLCLHDWDPDTEASPKSIRCSAANMADNGVYLLENGIYMFIWLGLNVSTEWLMAVFGVRATAEVNVERGVLPALDTTLSTKIRELVQTTSHIRPRSVRLTLVRQRDQMELVMQHFLIEDRGIDGSLSYVDFLCQMHREIRSILNS